MRLSLPFLLCAFIASLHYSTEAGRFSNSRHLLGKALLRRAREINEQENNNAGEVLEEEMPEDERERVLQTDANEDIFVGSGNHVYEKAETSGTRRDETSGDDESESDEEREDESPTSGDSNEGEEDESDEEDDEKSEDEEDDATEKPKDQETSQDKETTQDDDTSGSGQIEDENAERRSLDTSGSGSGSEQQDDDTEQSGSGESTDQEDAPSAVSQDEASGEEENASKKSEIETASGESEDEDADEESGSAEVIRKGIESLSRLLTPVASGYDFELYSGKPAKNDKEEEAEAQGESEKGFNSEPEEVHVKKCKRVCEEPMTYEQCAEPRCGYKMGTIKDLCIYLCKHQTPVCRQQCE